METINDVLRSKGKEIISVPPESTVFDALKAMADNNIGAVLVIDDSGKLQGIFSERDYARKIILVGKTSKNTKVNEIMTKKVFYAKADQSIEECMTSMTKNKIRHLPVLDDKGLAGVVSIGDIVKSLISEKDHLIDQLEHYISGSL
jgi:CBS domain-containing protein